MSKLIDFNGIEKLRSRFITFMKIKTHKYIVLIVKRYIILIVKSQPQSKSMATMRSS